MPRSTFRNDPSRRVLEEKGLMDAYARWAPVYDVVFGPTVEAGRKAAVEIANRTGGRLLDVGVGTGLSLPLYRPDAAVTGVDLSPQMLARARDRVRRAGLANIEAIREMDAQNLAFPDESFDTVVSMYTITAVPDPIRVMQEIVRVTKPGGTIVIVSHFHSGHPVWGRVENLLTPLTRRLGWRPELSLDAIAAVEDAELRQQRRLGLLNLFSVVEFVRAG
ncbi:class I SAM-dependent methyltransferase [Futiania mangrovi]|uniref:Class I SAM-dependent methyltransferase n=1 Tax=Futiania mangrovi TaxID=2959716 RepID=A0A9J6PED0_9PROT|nr:class I SAM-dependent methyltransferase [Futiania mangrovii]MCP1336184.1 class I SAM-dependent methyltransferase [Futiania mangrovii]